VLKLFFVVVVMSHICESVFKSLNIFSTHFIYHVFVWVESSKLKLWQCEYAFPILWFFLCIISISICINNILKKFVQIDFILSSSLWIHFSLISKFTCLVSLWVLRSVPWVCILLQNQRILKTFNLQCHLINLQMHHMDS
jgi:hypothetical protein